MNKYFKYFCIALIIILIIGLLYFIMRPKKKNEVVQQNEYIPQEEIEIDKNQINYKENVTVGELKNEIGATGDDKIYEITSEYDGRKILTIKPDIQFNVALAGLIDGEKPEINLKKLDEKAAVFQGKKGIWIEKDSRETFLKLLKETTKCSYKVDDDGYLICEQEQDGNEIDKELLQILCNDELRIIAITGSCYTVDEISGEIVEYPFEKMDSYQTSEVFEKDKQRICILSTNEKCKLSSEEIVKSVL